MGVVTAAWVPIPPASAGNLTRFGRWGLTPRRCVRDLPLKSWVDVDCFPLGWERRRRDPLVRLTCHDRSPSRAVHVGTRQVVGWREAQEKRLRPVSCPDARVEAHRSRAVFFVQRFVEFEDGRFGWIRRGGEAASGRKWTQKFCTEAAAQEEATRLKKEAAVNTLSTAINDLLWNTPPRPTDTLHQATVPDVRYELYLN
jgi:hypothetical protein